MSTCKKLLPLGAVALAFAFAPAEAAPAAPATWPRLQPSPTPARSPKCSGGGGRRYRYRGYRRGWGPGPWLGLGAGVVIGSIIANEAYRPRRGYYYDDYAYDGPYYYPSATRAIRARSAPRTSARSSGVRASIRPIRGEKRLCPYLR